MSGPPDGAPDPREPDPDAPDLLVDLASRRLGSSVVAANDEFYAEKENLILPAEPVFVPDTFGHKGQVYDGWETRRRRTPGSDWVIVRLGAPGRVRQVVVDTAHFTGNYPVACEVHGCAVDGYPSPGDLDSPDVEWVPLVALSPLRGDSRNVFRVPDALRLSTHVRLVIHPDGGVARLRVLGEPIPDPHRLAGLPIDLALVLNGGQVVEASNRFYSEPDHLLLPGGALTMGDGWETARRRGDGNDWVLLRLAGPSRLAHVVIDTTHFVGNAPGEVALSGCDAGRPGPGLGAPDGQDPEAWWPLLPRARLQPDTPHHFGARDGLDGSRVATHVRVDVYPDGGLARVRLFGHLSPHGWAALVERWSLARWNAVAARTAATEARAVCAATAWVTGLVAGRPFPDAAALAARSDTLVDGLDLAGVDQALGAHPRIGERAPGSGQESLWSRDEQSTLATADDRLRRELVAGNRAYEERFGHLYLVCTAGRTGSELLDLLRARLANSEDAERSVVRRELAAICRVRLAKLLHPPVAMPAGFAAAQDRG